MTRQNRTALGFLAGLLAGLLLLIIRPAIAQAPPPPGPAAAPGDEITLEKIMADPDWIGNEPEDPYWAADGRAVFYRQKRQGEERRDLWRIDLEGKGGAPRKVAEAYLGAVDTPGGVFSHDRRQMVYVREGDVYVHEAATGKVRQLTRTAAEESDPFFLVGDRRVAFHRGSATFVRNLDTGLESQPADLRLTKDPAHANDETEYLRAEGQRLFDVLREKRARQELSRKEERDARRVDPTLPPLPWYLGDKLEILTTALAPTGDWMIVVLGKSDGDETAHGKQEAMARFVTESGEVEVEKVRAKVGTGKPESPTLLLLDLRQHVRHTLDLSVLPGIKDDPLKELREKAEAARKAESERLKAARQAAGDVDEAMESKSDDDEKAGKTAEKGPGGEEKEAGKPAERVVRLDNVTWSEDGSRVVLQAFSADNKDRWIAVVDPAAPKLQPLERFTDPAWISWSFNDVGWLRDSRTVWYLSEQSGWSHLYLRPVDGAARQMTHGEFEVSSPVLSRDGKTFYLTANQERPGVYEEYRLDLSAAGGELTPMTQLSRLGGLNTFFLSPDERRLLALHSTATHPPELYVVDLSPGAKPARKLTDTVSPAFAAVRWSAPEVLPIPATHAPRPIWSRVYKPAGWSADLRWPAVVFVHGAGFLQNAHEGWSTYFHEFMFHSLLSRRGYVVLDMDYRASAGYGRDWRTAIYRQMGFPELEDLQDGVAWLTANRSVDPARVGVYGGSYGGFMTLMALFRAPDLFACGAALRPVSDWAHYNHDYTSNILNTPEIDPESYLKSSPVEYATGLTKPLLIAHGMVDDNVVFQDTVRLVQHLIELKKTALFETAIYPVEPHGFKQPSSWLDEYGRILELMEANLKK